MFQAHILLLRQPTLGNRIVRLRADLPLTFRPLFLLRPGSQDHSHILARRIQRRLVAEPARQHLGVDVQRRMLPRHASIANELI